MDESLTSGAVPGEDDEKKRAAAAGDGAAAVTRWLKEIDKASTFEEKWRERASNVVKRYRDERRITQTGAEDGATVQFNILYANVQVLKGQMYQRTPVPDVRRRFNDKDPIARQAAQILQRALTYTLDAHDFDGTMTDVTEDALLPGRGVARVKYTPTMGMVPMPPGPDGAPVLDAAGKPAMVEQVVFEEVTSEYTEWKWFRMSPATRWSKVRWIAFGELLTKKDLRAQFGEKVAAECSLDWHPIDKENEPEYSRALVWMIWDKGSKNLYAVCKGYPEAPLRVTPDPLNLEGFWPIPRPLYAATETSCSLVPVPEYLQYQDLAIELDTVTERIARLIDALRRRGIYDSNQPELEALASAGDNVFIPAENYAALMEKGGVGNLFVELPIDVVAKVVLSLYAQRDQIKAVIYEVTGISDIVRGSTKATETLGAQELKAQYSNSRIGTRQKAVAKFACGLLRLLGEIIADKFSAETLKLMTGPDLWWIEREMPDPATGKPITQKVDATNEIMALLRNDKLRGFRVDIETDSTIQPNAGEEQRNRTEFLTAITGFITGLAPIVQSGVMPLEVAKEFLSFGARAFRVAPQLEDAIDKLGGDGEGSAAGKQAQGQEQATQAAEAQMATQKAEIDKRAMQLQVEEEAFKGAQAAEQKRLDAEVRAREHQFTMAELDRKEEIARIEHAGALERARIEGERATCEHDSRMTEMQRKANEDAERASVSDARFSGITEGHRATADEMMGTMDTLAMRLDALMTMMRSPKKVLRGPDGRAIGVEQHGAQWDLDRDADGRMAGVRPRSN